VGVRERKKQEARAEEEGRGVKSQIFGCHIVKNKGAQLAAINVGPTASEKRSPTCACLDMTGARPRDASILAGPEGLNRPRSITSNHLVHHNGQDASTPRIVRTAHNSHIIHVAHDYLNGTI
jgi:hypothetical protein